MVQIKRFYVVLLFSFIFINSITPAQKRNHSHLPIVLVHGIMSDNYAMIPTIKYIQKYMPGTYVRNVEIGSGEFTSLWNMYDQAHWLAKQLENDPNLQDGFNMICHSQGGLIGRYYVERYNNPRVYNYISWGSPQNGIFGTPSKIDNRFVWLNYLERYTYRLLYSSFF